MRQAALRWSVDPKVDISTGLKALAEPGIKRVVIANPDCATFHWGEKSAASDKAGYCSPGFPGSWPLCVESDFQRSRRNRDFPGRICGRYVRLNLWPRKPHVPHACEHTTLINDFHF
jgi:hypothetical protein